MLNTTNVARVILLVLVCLVVLHLMYLTSCDLTRQRGLRSFDSSSDGRRASVSCHSAYRTSGIPGGSECQEFSPKILTQTTPGGRAGAESSTTKSLEYIPDVHSTLEPSLIRLTTWPRGDINVHKLPTILLLGCVKRNCKPKKISCLEDITTKRLGNSMWSTINAVWLADNYNVSVKVTALNKPGIVSLPMRLGLKDKSCPRKTPPQNEVKLLFWPSHRSANKILCHNCITPSPGAGWEAGPKARQYLDLDDTPAVPNTTLVMHMRGEDIFDPDLKNQHPHFVQPPCSWYSFLIRTNGYKEVLIVSSVDRNNPCISRIEEVCKHGNVLLHFSSGSIRDDYSTLSRASHLAIGFSTYAMTAAYVSPNLQLLHLPMYEKDGLYHALPIYLGYGGRGIRLISYLISNYIVTWSVEKFSLVLHHPERYIDKYVEFEV